MPSIVSYRKCVASVWREWHLRFLRFSSVREDFVENSSNLRCRIIGRQIKLDSDALPEAVGVFKDTVSGNVASEDRHGIHFDLRKVVTESTLQTGPESLHESFA